MSQAAFIVLGAIVGALATGGVAAWDAWRQRVQRRRVAARLILGDLYFTEAMAQEVLRRKRWPDRVDFEAPLDTWRECRDALAGGVEAWEWTRVDIVFANLHRSSLMVRPSQETTPQDERVFQRLLESIPEVRLIVLRHAASKRELERLVQLSAERSAAAQSP